MNQIVNEELCKNMNDDDLFFQPKNMKKRDEEIKKQNKKELKERKSIFSKIKLGLKNIKRNYKNKNWDSKEEELFLQLSHKLHLDEKYNEQWNGYVLKSKNDEDICAFNLKNNMFYVSYYDFWSIFRNEFNWSDIEIQSFKNDMLKKHFKLYKFITDQNQYIINLKLKKHLELYEFMTCLMNKAWLS